MSESGLRIEREGDVEILTLDRPDARNALTHELYGALEAAVRDCLLYTSPSPRD